MTDLEEAREYFLGDKYAMMAGCEILAVGPNYAKCRMPLDERHKNANGGVMGGCFFTLADFTFAVATNFHGRLTVTATASTQFLSAPHGDFLVSEARLLKEGRRNCFYEISVTDAEGRPVVLATFTGTHLDDK